ncbi:D-2-hydroxyacid dehydrogenase [Halobacteriales archaeon QS_8_69_26]|nr:MAG: D-2-hydroxyacid dehydrogenase [Halobacteriales archaeon QS_8_69_26]
MDPDDAPREDREARTGGPDRRSAPPRTDGGDPDAPTVLIPHAVGADRAAEVREAIAAAGGSDPAGWVPPSAIRTAVTLEESRRGIRDAEVVVTFRLSEELLDAAENLRWVQALSAGVDHYDRDRLSEMGVALTNASGVHAEPIAEQVLGYVLAFERGLVTAMRNKERGVWERHSPGELRGKTVGVVGVGAIGTRVAEFCSVLGMEVVGSKRDTGDVPEAVDEIHGSDGIYDVLLAADYAVLACPLTDETRGLIGSDELRALGDDGVLVNVARGEVVDQDALTRALQNHSVRGAALDVFEEEPLPSDSVLWDLSNVLITPHNAGSTPHYYDRCAELFVENYRRYREGGVDALKNRIL